MHLLRWKFLRFFSITKNLFQIRNLNKESVLVCLKFQA